MMPIALGILQGSLLAFCANGSNSSVSTVKRKQSIYTAQKEGRCSSETIGRFEYEARESRVHEEQASSYREQTRFQDKQGDTTCARRDYCLRGCRDCCISTREEQNKRIQFGKESTQGSLSILSCKHSKATDYHKRSRHSNTDARQYGTWHTEEQDHTTM